jgi:hypothetical protein
MTSQDFVNAIIADYYESIGEKWEPKPSIVDKVEPIFALIVWCLMLGFGLVYIATLILSLIEK